MQQQRNKARTPETATRCQLWRQMKLPAVMMQGGGEGLGGEGGGKVGGEPVKVAAMALVRNRVSRPAANAFWQGSNK